MRLKLSRSNLRGEVRAVASKSAAHRALICAALADTPTYVDFDGISDDISATIRCLTALGCEISPTPSGVLVTPGRPGSFPALDCGESGSTLRFLLPVAAALGGGFTVSGRGRLAGRPLGELASAMAEHGCELSSACLPLSVSGRLRPGVFILPGDVSSQYVSGLLFALPLLNGDSRIVLSTPLSSAAYVDMTLAALAAFGIQVITEEHGWFVRGSQRYLSPGRLAVEGDWSAAAVWLCAGALGAPVTVTGLNAASAQPDRRILKLLSDIGADVSVAESAVTVSRGSLKPLEVDIDASPDLMPVLTALLACCPGVSAIRNAARLRLKESDRLAAMSQLLTALGVPNSTGPDRLELRGGAPLPGEVSGENDHRIVMAAALMSCRTELTISGCEAVNKSYPRFFEDFTALGGVITRL